MEGAKRGRGEEGERKEREEIKLLETAVESEECSSRMRSMLTYKSVWNLLCNNLITDLEGGLNFTWHKGLKISFIIYDRTEHISLVHVDLGIVQIYLVQFYYLTRFHVVGYQFLKIYLLSVLTVFVAEYFSLHKKKKIPIRRWQAENHILLI